MAKASAAGIATPLALSGEEEIWGQNLSNVLIGFVDSIGASVLRFVRSVGGVAIFAGNSVAASLTPPFYVGEILRQFWRIGYLSLPVVGLTALFTGAVLALQIYIGGSRFNAESVVPSIVAIGIARELGPVIAGLMVAGRVAAAIAAEIGTMRVTEQIDALASMGTNPIQYLVVPRLLACLAIIS